MKLYVSRIETPLSPVILAATERNLVFVQFAPSSESRLVRRLKEKFPDRRIIEGENKLLSGVLKELKKYFEGKLKSFSIPLDPKGTPFQKRIWQALSNIPYGETRTYGEIGVRLGVPKASRAVGRACNQNPIAIIIPCHRVVGKDGKLTGYSAGLEKKRWLLEFEKKSIGKALTKRALKKLL